MATAISEKLGEILRLETIGPDHFQSRHNDSNLRGEVFGGQYLGQAVAAAIATAPGREPHVLQGFFLRAARAADPLDLIVERTRDGRGFSHRRVTIMQHGREMFRAEVSLHVREQDQPTHQAPMPEAPAIDGLQSFRDLIVAHGDVLGAVAVARVTNKALFTTYPVEPVYGVVGPAEEAKAMHWIRLSDFAPDTPEIQYAAIAYASDIMANMTSRIMHGANMVDDSMAALSLNHGIWFHNPPRADQPMLFSMESPAAGHGLGFNRGLIFGHDGTLYASHVQEALIRRL